MSNKDAYAVPEHFNQIKHVNRAHHEKNHGFIRWHSYFDTREEAVQHIIDREQQRIKQMERNVKMLRANLKRFMTKEGKP